MTTITLQDLRKKGSKAIPNNQVVYLIINSKTKAVLVPPEQYEALMEMLEDMEDIKAIEERRNEPTLSWDEVFPKKRNR